MSIGSGNTINSLFGQGIHFTPESNFLRDYLFTRISLTDKTNQQRMELELRNMGGKQRQLLNERQRLLDNIARMTKSVQDTIQANINRESKEERADRKARSRDVARNTRRARSARDKAERDQRKAWEKARKADSWGRDHFAANKSSFFSRFGLIPTGQETRIDDAQIKRQYLRMWQDLNSGPIDRPIEGGQKPGATFLHAYTALKTRNPEAAKAFKQVVFQASRLDPNMPVLATEGTGSWQALHLLHNDEDMFGVHLERVLSDPQYNVQRASSDPDAARQVGQDIAAEYDGNGDPQTARTRGIIAQYQVRLAEIDAELKGLAEGRTEIIERRFGRQSFSQLMTPYTYVSPQQEAALRVVAKMPEQERAEFLSDARMIIPSLRADVAPPFVEDNLLNEERILEHRSAVQREFAEHQQNQKEHAARAHHIKHQQEELKARLDAGEISEEEFGFRNEQLEGRRIDQQNRANRAQERMELSKILLQDLEFLTTGGGVASEWSRLPPAGRLRVIQGMNAREVGHADRLRVQISDARESVDSLEQEVKQLEREIGPRTSEAFLKNPSANEALQELGRENEMLSSLLLQQNRWVQRAGESRRAVDYLVLNDPEYKVAAQSPDAALGVQGPIAEEVDFSAIDSATSSAEAPVFETLDEEQAKEERFFRGEDGVPGLAEDEQFQSIREKLRRNQELSSEKAALMERQLELSVEEEARLDSISRELEGLSSDPELIEYFDWYSTQGSGDKDLYESVSDYAQFKIAEAEDVSLAYGEKPEGLFGPQSRLPTSPPVGPPEELPAELDITPEGYIARGGTPDEFSPSDYLKRFISDPPENKQEAEDLRRFLYPSEDDRGGILEVQALSGADYNKLVERIAPAAAEQFDVPMERQVFEEAPEPAIELEDTGPGLLQIDNLGNAPVTDASINAYINEMDRRTKDAILNASPENPASTALRQVFDDVANGYVNGGVAEEIWMTEQGRLQLAALQDQIEYYAHEDFQSGRINEADLDDNLRGTEGLGLLLEQTEQGFLSKTDAEPAAQEPAAQEPVTVDDDFFKPISLEEIEIEETEAEPYQLTAWEQHMIQLRDAGQLTPKPGEDEGAGKGRENLRASLEAIYKKRPDLMPSQAPAPQPEPAQESRAPLNLRDIGDTDVLADEIGFRLEGAATAADTKKLIEEISLAPVIREMGLTGRGREQLRKLVQHGKAQGPDSDYESIQGFLEWTEEEFQQKLYEQMKPKESNIQYEMTPEGVIEESDEDVLSSAMLGSRNHG
jgi:hypothetical protein